MMMGWDGYLGRRAKGLRVVGARKRCLYELHSNLAYLIVLVVYQEVGTVRKEIDR